MQREQQQKIGGRDRSAATSSASNQSSGTGNSASGSGTATPVSSGPSTAATACSTNVSVALMGQNQVNSLLAASTPVSQDGASAADGNGEATSQSYQATQTTTNQVTTTTTTTTTTTGQNHVESSESRSENNHQGPSESFSSSGFARKDDASNETANVVSEQKPSAEYGAIDSISVPHHPMESQSTTKKDLR